jgi:hypothetical protein
MILSAAPNYDLLRRMIISLWSNEGEFSRRRKFSLIKKQYFEKVRNTALFVLSYFIIPAIRKRITAAAP